MKNYAFILFMAIVAAISPVSGIAESRDIADKYQRDHSRGYWFYDDPVEPVDAPPPVKVEPQESLVDLAQPEPQPPQIQPPAAPIELTVEWLQVNTKKYMHKAIDDPSPENVRAYLYLQRLMLDKSQRFADATQLALITDPLLDENTRRPIASFGGTQKNRESEDVMDNLFERLSGRVGVWFFFRQDEMGMNDIQAGVLEMLERSTGITVQAISMDGSFLPNGRYPNAKVDNGQSKILNIVQTPALFVVNPSTNQIMPIGQAALALPDLKKRVLVASVSADWITEEEFAQTRGMRAELTMESTPSFNQTVLDSPQQIANELQKILKTRSENGF